MNVTLMGLLWAVATSNDGCTNCVDNPNLPEFEKIIPKKQEGMSDQQLLENFPGQFYSKAQIAGINSIENMDRERRNTDYDLCCPTQVWFGPAPAKMKDIDGQEWNIVCGDTVQQAFSRGDCVDTQPQDRCTLSQQGACKQKTRLVWLWVEKEPGSNDYLYKYFHTNSHCAYETISQPRNTSTTRTTTDN